MSSDKQGERAAGKNNAVFTVMTSKKSLSVVVCLLSFFLLFHDLTFLSFASDLLHSLLSLLFYLGLLSPPSSSAAVQCSEMADVWQWISAPSLSHINWCKSVKSIVCCWSNSITSQSVLWLLLPNGTN